MKPLTSCCWAIACLLMLSCKKEMIQTESNLSIISNEKVSSSVVKEAKWQGEFVSYNGLPPSFFVTDKYFINNGYARIYNGALKFSKQNYYSTKKLIS